MVMMASMEAAAEIVTIWSMRCLRDLPDRIGSSFQATLDTLVKRGSERRGIGARKPALIGTIGGKARTSKRETVVLLRTCCVTYGACHNSGSANRRLMSASLRKRPNCCDAAKCRDGPIVL